MKKKMIILSIALMLFFMSGCDMIEDMVQDAKEQMEWTEEHNARTNGMSMEEALEDVTGIEISSENDESELSEISNEVYDIGDTVSLSFTSENTTTDIDISITGYEPVYNGESNVTAIFYTVKSKSGYELKFDNSSFKCYANNTFVQSSFWNDYDIFSYGILMPGTSYEGCYVADVDPNVVRTIDLYLGDTMWHIQKEEIPVQVYASYDASVGLALSGLYSDDVDSCDVSFYSSIENSYVGTFTVTLDGNTYSGELEYDEKENCYYGTSDNFYSVCLFFKENSMVRAYVESRDGSVDYRSELMGMVEHYES